MTGPLTFAGQTLDWQMVHRFRALIDLNLARLRDQVRTRLVGSESVLLSDVLQRFPPREGILEVVGYLVVATQDAQHYVADDEFADVRVNAASDSGDGCGECPCRTVRSGPPSVMRQLLIVIDARENRAKRPGAAGAGSVSIEAFMFCSDVLGEWLRPAVAKFWPIHISSVNSNLHAITQLPR